MGSKASLAYLIVKYWSTLVFEIKRIC